MNLIFAGTPAFAAVALEALVAAGHRVSLVLTQPDRPAGRGMQLQPSAVKQVALRHGLALAQPERLKDPATHEPLRAVAADLMVVAAYGLILPQAVLDIPRQGCINIHASLLPRWRGAAPIQRAIEAGDAETGVTIMQMDAGLDTGDLLLAEATPIAAAETSATLQARLAQLGGELIVRALAALAEGRLAPRRQADSQATYAAKIAKAEATIDWREPAATIERRLRAFDPFPGARSTLAGEAITCWRGELRGPARGEPGEIVALEGGAIRVACGEASLAITEVQRAGGKRMAAADFLRGRAPRVGDRFGSGTSGGGGA
jgi:methionyl-tRNA formyltransferase